MAHADADVAAYVRSFLDDCPWVRRRVEKIEFVDDATISRHTTLDLSGVDLTAVTQACPFHADRPIVPIAVLRKNLLVHFDLRDNMSQTLAVLPREVDTFFAWSLLMEQAGQSLGDQVDEEIANFLWSLAFSFPDPDDDPFQSTVRAWVPPQAWSHERRRIWRRLLEDPTFSRFLRDFTFNYLLLTQVTGGQATHIIKYSYHQHFPFKPDKWPARLGWVPPEIQIDAPAVGWGRSYHLEINLPRELRGIGPILYRLVQDQGRDGLLALPAEPYDTVSQSRSVEIHTTDVVRPADHVLAVPVRLSLAGYLRAIWISTLFAALVLLLGRLNLPSVVKALNTKSEAAVALLLVIPSLITAYLIRPEEHAIASSLLRHLRYLAALAGMLTYLAAGTLVLGVSGGKLADMWTVLCVVSCAIALSFSVAVIRTSADCRDADKVCGDTRQQQVLERRLKY